MKNIASIVLAGCFLLTLTAGFESCTKDDVVGGKASSSPHIDSISPGLGAANAVLTVYGSGLGQIQNIMFDSGQIAAPFNPVFNTDNALIFRVPTDAIPAQQNIVFTNSLGTKITIPFTVLGFPTITDISDYNYSAATPQIILYGKNLADVTHVALAGAADTAIIVAATPTSLTLTMPVTTTTTDAKLNITNSAGTITTTQSFVNVDNTFPLFTDGYAPGFQDASWGDAGFINTSVVKRGDAAVSKNYAKGNWHQFGFGWTNIDKSNNFKYLSFWIHGGTKDYDLWISTNASEGGFASFNDYDKIHVSANVWTYFKLPVADLKLWATADQFNQIGWRIQGPNDNDEVFTLDDVIFIK